MCAGENEVGDIGGPGGDIRGPGGDDSMKLRRRERAMQFRGGRE